MFGMTKQAMPCCGGNGDHIGNCHARVQMKRSTTEDYPPIGLSAMLQAGSAPADAQLARDIDAARGVKPAEAPKSAGGGLSDYYLVFVSHPQRTSQSPYVAECEDIIEALGLDFDEGNIFKEIWRTANARKNDTGKPGNTPLRAAEKIAHYAKRILRRERMA